MNEHLITEVNEADIVCTFESIIKGVLNSLRIIPTYAYYDDCYQIGLIKLFEAIKDYPYDLQTEEGLYRFGGYAFVKIKWGVIDECRKVKRYNLREEKLPESYEELAYQCYHRIEDELIEEIDLAHFLLWLTPKEHEYLNLFLTFRNISHVAKTMGLSRKTVYAIRRKIAEKYQLFQGI